MQVAYSLLDSCERCEHKEVDGRNASVQSIINDVHLVHPVFVHSWIPEELHHDAELGQLRDLTEQNEANVESECPRVDSQIATLLQVALNAPNRSEQQDRRPQSQDVLDAQEDRQ